MMDVVMFALGGLTGLVLWWLVVGPLFHGFMHGLAVTCLIRSPETGSRDVRVFR